VAAVQVPSGTRVAIKYLADRLFRDERFLTGFRSEAQLLRSLADPHVVRLYDYAEAPGQGAAIVMELVNGVSLHEMITRQGPTGPESALATLKGSLLGLAAAHALGIVHRDYKPENVLVDAEGTSKLSDFGVAVRAGDDAPTAGTPLYMAPEQWAGAPATPATDIYAATAVFFECLTGTTPFTGRPIQLHQQHAATSVPVDQIDEPLRALVARGMAKDPAARPANALEFVTELETTATAAYGTDWESRGRGHLAARAAALLLLLLPGSAVTAAGTSTTSTYTMLAASQAATRATAKGGGTGFSGMQMAIAGAALVVVVAAGAAGGWVAGKHHKTANAAPGPTGTSSGPSASPSPTATTAALTSPACGSGPPPLAYVTQIGSAFPTTTVAVRCGTGSPHTVATIHNDSVSTLAWSADGTQLAWLTAKTMSVAQVKAGTWTLRNWSCQGCNGTAFQGDHAVTIAPQPAGTGLSLHARTQLLAFPSSGSGQPTTLPVTRLPTDPYLLTRFWLLGSVSPTDVVVDYGDMGGSNAGGPQLLFHVNSAGQATQYGHATIGLPPGPNTIFGAVGNLTASQAGSEIAFSTYSQAGISCESNTADVLDTATGTITTPKVPAGGGPDGWLVQGMWFDQTGAPYVSLVPNQANCKAGTAPSGGPLPGGVAPVVCKLSGDSWVKTGSGIFRAAYGPGTWQAEETGVTVIANSPGRSLTISEGTRTTPVTVSGGVTAFAWAPFPASPTGTATPAVTGIPTAPTTSASPATPPPSTGTPSPTAT
jgi:serine/threonine-protein kinase